MERTLETELKRWKLSPIRKPLLLLGARQVGKTWLMQHFGHKHYQSVVYIRFDRNERMRRIFETSNFDMQELLLLIQAETKTKVQTGEMLIILDEIQDFPHA